MRAATLGLVAEDQADAREWLTAALGRAFAGIEVTAVDYFHAQAATDAVNLTERERDVLTLLAKGFTVRKVASLLEDDTCDFNIGRRLHNLDELKTLGFAADRRLLGVQRY